MKHYLKTRPEFFDPAWAERKTFEIRNNDRDFKQDDDIVLQEYVATETHADGYTGREITGVIEYVTGFEQKPGFVVFAWRLTSRKDLDFKGE